MNKKCKKIEKKLSKHLNTLYKKPSKKLNAIINIGLVILTTIMFMMLISQIGGFHNIEYHLINVLFLLLSMLGIKVAITLINQWVFGKKYSVIDIVEISGYIKKYNETMYIPNTGSTTLTYYYFDLVNNSEVPTTLIISPLQNKAIEWMLNNHPLHKLYTYKVAILEPKSSELIHKTLKDGTLLLLPLEDFFAKKDGFNGKFNSNEIFEDDSNEDQHIICNSEYQLKLKNKNTWFAPSQYNHQPTFKAARSAIKPDTEFHLICEDKVSIQMDFIPFKPSKLIEDINQLDEPKYEYNNIEDVLYNTNEKYDEFQDFSTRSEPIKNGKGPNFLVYCLISYAINYFFFGFLLNHQTPGLFFSLNLLITSALFIAIAKVAFFPLFVKTPVRFHRKNKEIYIHTNNSLYKIPWEESDISIIVKQNKITTNYYLTLWLDPKYDVNNHSDTVIPFTLWASEDIHGKVYYFWDYINRYMKYAAPFSIIKQKKQLKEPEKEEIKENKEISYQLFSLLISIIIFPIFIIFNFSNHNELRRVLNPFKLKWPEKVHEWTGKRCNWH